MAKRSDQRPSRRTAGNSPNQAVPAPYPLPVPLADLLSARTIESDRLEFKEGWNPAPILRTICAFANDFHNYGGGYVIVGVAERDGLPVLPPAGVPAGQINRIQKELLEYTNLIQPHYAPILAVEEVNEASVLIIWCPGGDDRPYRVPQGVTARNKEYAQYIRRYASTIIARNGDLREPWAFALPIDLENKFPGVEAVIPRASAATGRLQLDPEEAARLAAVLPRLPGGGDEQAPVTLALGKHPAVRAKGDSDPDAVEVLLDRSSCTGTEAAVVVNRAYLLRAMALGFNEVQVNHPTKPVTCRDRKRIYLWMPLEPVGAVLPGPRVKRVPLLTAGAQTIAAPIPRKRIAASPVTTNGHATTPVAALAAPSPDRVTVADVIGEAVGVAGLLRDAANRVARLVAALRRQRHQTRAVQQAVRSLKQLQLDH